MVLDQGLRAKLQTLSLLTGQLSIELIFDPLADELDNMNNIRAQVRDGFFPTRLNFLDAVSNRIGEKHFRNQMESIQKIIAQITDCIDSGKSKQLLDDISIIAGNLRTTTDTLNQKFPPLLDDAQSTVADAKSLVGHANEQLAPLVSNTNQLMKRIGLVSEAARLLLNNLNEITTNSQPQVESILAKVNTSLDEAQLTLEDTRSSLKDARSVIAPNSPTRLQLEKTLDNCQDTLDSLRTLIENLNRNPQILLMGE
jgi:paraquat-inducible protein B